MTPRTDSDSPGDHGPGGLPKQQSETELRVEQQSSRAIATHMRYQGALRSHAGLIERVRAARTRTDAIHQAVMEARAIREQAAAARSVLRHVIRAEVVRLKTASVAPEGVLRLLRDSLVEAAQEHAVNLPSTLVDQIRDEVIQWAIEDYYAAA